MRNANNVFHLAIPCRDLQAAAAFYEALGSKVARTYEDRITLNFFGAQVVCHLSPDGIDLEPKMYPRHFGVTFSEELEFKELMQRARQMNLPFFEKPFTRFEGKPEEHSAFFLIDPSNNLLEFKYYKSPKMMY